eukprot:c17028_g1_i1 orf=240-677(+)
MHHLLLNADNDDDNSTVSSAELEACHTRASELAAILKEDSPDLSFNSPFNTQHTGTPFRYAPPPLNIPASHHPCEEDNCAADASTISPNKIQAYHSKASDPSLRPFQSRRIFVNFESSIPLSAKVLQVSCCINNGGKLKVYSIFE